MVDDALCRRYQALLPGLPERQTPLPVELDAHLDRCPDCQAAGAWLAGLEATLRAEGPREVPPALLGATMARIALARRPTPLLAWRRAALSAAALLLVSLVLGLSLAWARPRLPALEVSLADVGDSLRRPTLEVSLADVGHSLRRPALGPAALREPPPLPDLSPLRDWLTGAGTRLAGGPLIGLAALVGALWCASTAWLFRLRQGPTGPDGDLA